MFITYRKYSKYSLWAILACSLSFTSCKKALDFSPEDKLDSSKMYNTLADADAVVLGIYGQVAGLGERYIVLNELRADLIDVTQNANPYLQQVSNHEVAEDNPYADPSAFYKIIFNCNDALKNFKVMERQGKLSNTEFNQRYSDLAMLRAWLYLQLGIHFGDVPYIKNTIESVDEIKSLENYPKTTFDHLVDSLIKTLMPIRQAAHWFLRQMARAHRRCSSVRLMSSANSIFGKETIMKPQGVTRDYSLLKTITAILITYSTSTVLAGATLM